VVLFGTDQRITSGPAAMAAASRRRQSSKRKQAGYMTAPERFADTSDSSCTAGAHAASHKRSAISLTTAATVA
jgi:hypothetical protein